MGGARALGIDLSKCEIDPRKQRKLRVKGRDGKEHHVCAGEAVCAGKTVPVSCEISEREPCPIAKECIKYEELMPGEIYCSEIKESEKLGPREVKPVVDYYGRSCGGVTGAKYITLFYKGRFPRVFVYTKVKSKLPSETRWNEWAPVCFWIDKDVPPREIFCSGKFYEEYQVKIMWTTDKHHPR